MAATSWWAWCWRKPPAPAMSPSWPAPWDCRWSHPWKVLPTMPAAATQSRSTAKPARCTCGRPARSSRPLRTSVNCASRPRPALPRYQVRALLNASAGRTLRILLPMVSDVDEFNRGRALIDRELERARLLNLVRPTQVLVGAMLEVPALAFMLPQLMRSADFVSIGSNDLLSLAFAVDRTNPRVSKRYDNLNPASLTLIRLIVQSAAENSGDLSLCGEMAGRPLDAMALLGLGIRTLSMQPGQIGPIKMMIRSLHLGEVSAFVDRLCNRTDHSLRTRLSAFAAERGIFLK